MEKKVLKRFCKDYRLPIIIFDEPHFSHFVDMYDEHFQTKQKLNILQEEMDRHTSAEEFLSFSDTLIKSMISALKDTDAYMEFNHASNPDFSSPLAKMRIPQTVCGVKFKKSANIYNMENAGKKLLSIDLKKANFQVLKKYNKDIVLRNNTWEDLVKNFTDSKYMLGSKSIREVVFGNLNMSRIIELEKWYTAEILNYLIVRKICKPEQVKVFTNDEIIIESGNLYNTDFCSKLQKDIYADLGTNVSVESFNLASIGDKPFFVKEITDGTREFKGVPSFYFAQAFVKYYGLELTESDLMFFYEKHPAKFLEPLFPEN